MAGVQYNSAVTFIHNSHKWNNGYASWNRQSPVLVGIVDAANNEWLEGGWE